MAENTRAGVAEPEKTSEELALVESRPAYRRWIQFRQWLIRQLKKPIVYVILGFAIALFVFLGIQYLRRLARLADRRLAEGPFAMTTKIFSAPSAVAVGDPITQDDLVGRLERSGYARTPNNPGVDSWCSPMPWRSRPSLDPRRNRHESILQKGESRASGLRITRHARSTNSLPGS